MTFRRKLTTTAAALAAASVLADEGRVEISQAMMPMVITGAGSYVATENLSGVAGSNGITIAASYVTVDLNGFTLAGVAGAHDGVKVLTNLNNVTIKNGIVRNWSDGVDALFASNGVVRGILASDNTNAGILAGFNFVVERCLAFRNGGIPGPGPVPFNTNGPGLRAENGSVVRQVVSWHNNEHGLVGHSGSSLSDSVLYGNGHDGFHGSHATVVRGCAVGANSEGVEVDSGSVVSECASSDNFEDGIRTKADAGIVQGGTLVSGSVVFNNGDNGVDLSGDGSAVASCSVVSNSGHGIRLDATNCLAARSLMARNGTAGGGDDGMHIYAQGSRIEGNHAVYNLDEGIQVETSGGIGHFVVRNTAMGNTGTDIAIPATNHGHVVASPPGPTLPKDPWANFDMSP